MKLSVSIQQDIERCLTIAKTRPNDIDAVEATARLVRSVELWASMSHNGLLQKALDHQDVEIRCSLLRRLGNVFKAGSEQDRLLEVFNRR